MIKQQEEMRIPTDIDKHILFLELGIDGNTPVIIKYPFLRMTAQNPQAVYACVNLGEAFTRKGLEKQSIIIDSDIGNVLNKLLISK